MCGSNSWSNPGNQNNKSFTIKPGLGEWLQVLRINRGEEVILARLRIGHSYITHSYLLKGGENPQCIPCNASLTIKHILVDCVDLAPTRQRFFDVILGSFDRSCFQMFTLACNFSVFKAKIL